MRVSEYKSFVRKNCWFIVVVVGLFPLVSMGDERVLHIGGTTLVPRTICDTEHKLWFRIGNEKMCLPMTTEYVTGTLHVKHNGVTYSAGRLELFYEATVFNSCQSVSLPQGRYCVDLLGGSGGDGGNNSGSGVASTDEKSKCFEITETTTASVFRGGDGNSGSVNSSGGVRSGGGGGASGVPSLVAFGNTVLVSTGGAGGMGGNARDYSGDDGNCGAGGGGNAAGGGDGLDGVANAVAFSNETLICGGGGGGAVSGSGGTGASDRLLWSSYTAGAGSAATANGGGAGGAVQRNSSSKNGGTGGNNTKYTCGGTTLISYGGGGGGAVGTRYSGAVDLNGGNGGSGSTGSSSSSYVRIYRFE